MVVSKTINGTLLLTSSYQMIYPILDDDLIRDPRWTEGWLFLHELTAGDIVQIKFSTYDQSGQLMRGYDEPIVSGSQGNNPAFHLGAVLSSWFRVEVKQNAAPASYKTINFTFYEVA